jgi:hypothetical protein
MSDVTERPTRQQAVEQLTPQKTRGVRKAQRAKARGKGEKSRPGTPAPDPVVNELMIQRIMTALIYGE